MKKINEPITVRCGKERDGFEKLQAMCEKEAEKMMASINISTGEEVKVAFWTSDPCSELIDLCHSHRLCPTQRNDKNVFCHRAKQTALCRA